MRFGEYEWLVVEKDLHSLSAEQIKEVPLFNVMGKKINPTEIIDSVKFDQFFVKPKQIKNMSPFNIKGKKAKPTYLIESMGFIGNINY